MLHTLRRGQFLTEQPSKQSFRMRAQGQADLSAEETARTEAFYKDSVDELLTLLGDSEGPSVIPDGARELAHAIHDKLGDIFEHRKVLPRFLTTRWLFGSFLMDLLVLPESHGLLSSHYVTDIARQKILREVAARSQKVVFDVIYAWKNGSILSVGTVDRVQKVIARFDFSNVQRNASSGAGSASADTLSAEQFVVLSPADVLSVMNSLYPARRPVSVSSDHDTLRSGLQSSASSISGFSLFRATETPAPSWPATPSLPFAAASPGRLLPPFEGVNEPEPLNRPAADFDPDVMDARSELEEYVAAHRTNDVTRWALVVSDERTCQLYTCTELFSRERHHSTLPRKHATAGDLSQLTPTDIAAIETLLSSAHDSDVPLPSMNSTALDESLKLSTRLLDLFDAKVAESEARSDFVSAHTWLRHTEAVEDLIALHGPDALTCIVREIEDTAQASLNTSSAISDLCNGWVGHVQPTLQSASSRVERAIRSQNTLRTKMWYSADVRTSSAYDNLRAITSALRVMGKSRRSNSTKQAPPLRHWNGTRVSNQNIHLKSEARILELLGTVPEYGGPNKLSDEQSRLTLAWLRRNDIEVLCTGEERLHKLCMELRKCVEQLVTSPQQENPLLWSNALFAHESNLTPRSATPNARLFTQESTPRRFDLLSLHTGQLAVVDSISNASRTLSSSSSRDHFDRSPTLATTSSNTFWSPTATEIRSPSSTTTIASQPGKGFQPSPRRPTTATTSRDSHTLDALREEVTGLLLSDIGSGLFVEGSETDSAFFAGLGGDLTEQHLESITRFTDMDTAVQEPSVNGLHHALRRRTSFDFEHAFKAIFEMFATDCNPYAKLKHLSEVQKLLRPYLTQRRHFIKPTSPEDQTDQHVRSVAGKHLTPSSSLLTEGFYILFSQRNLRPQALFRDLQYIASLIPSSTLDSSPHGPGFWNAAAAVLRLKSEASKKLVETADSIIDYHTNNRGHGRSASSAQQQRDSATFSAPSRTPSAELIAHYSMADAALLLQITAREGDPAAQRELATLYLTHPELMDPVVAPFALPSEVFRDEIEGRWKRDRDPERCDPRTMCVAHHWMVLGAKRGDALAREFLRQREEMERLP
ncbi:hypothetical protein WHR41_01533 [Cladosporium halotolerans]|uniref:Uncharacterized protein n=1 Tax=Cladosporium halotolerans TaxID=1052096 RepID=A0AB34KXX6_9PEZI